MRISDYIGRKEQRTLADTVSSGTVRAFMEEYEFHAGAILDINKRNIARIDDAAWFLLSGFKCDLYIPIEVYRSVCHFKPSEKQGLLFDWDYEAEAKANGASNGNA